MFAALGYDGATAAAATWLSNLSPILVLLAGIGLALALGGLALSLMGSRGASDSLGSSRPSGLDKRTR